MLYQYKVETFNCYLLGEDGIKEKADRLLQDYSLKGWKLHTMQMVGNVAYLCICVFEKPIASPLDEAPGKVAL